MVRIPWQIGGCEWHWRSGLDRRRDWCVVRGGFFGLRRRVRGGIRSAAYGWSGRSNILFSDKSKLKVNHLRFIRFGRFLRNY